MYGICENETGSPVVHTLISRATFLIIRAIRPVSRTCNQHQYVKMHVQIDVGNVRHRPVNIQINRLIPETINVTVGALGVNV